MDMLGLKSKILEELLDDLDDNDGMKIKPKAAISVTAMKPGMEDPSGSEMPDLDKAAGDDDDDELKMLLDHYMSQK